MKSFFIIVLYISFPFVVFSQKLPSRDYIVMSFQQKDIMGSDTFFWIADIDSVRIGRFKLFPIYKYDLPISKYNIERIIKGDTIWYANINKGSEAYINNDVFFELVSQNSFFYKR